MDVSEIWGHPAGRQKKNKAWCAVSANVWMAVSSAENCKLLTMFIVDWSDLDDRMSSLLITLEGL